MTGMTAQRIGTAHLEKNLESFFRKRVRLLGGITEKLIPASKGIPDQLVLLPGGRIFLVELKSEDGERSPAQVVWHRRAETLGVHVPTLSSRQQVLDWLRTVTSHPDEEEDL